MADIAHLRALLHARRSSHPRPVIAGQATPLARPEAWCVCSNHIARRQLYRFARLLAVRLKRGVGQQAIKLVPASTPPFDNTNEYACHHHRMDLAQPFWCGIL